MLYFLILLFSLLLKVQSYSSTYFSIINRALKTQSGLSTLIYINVFVFKTIIKPRFPGYT
jgi:hypothetical protein